jgi:hypothetical protein
MMEGKLGSIALLQIRGCQQSCITASHLYDSFRTLMISKLSHDSNKLM